MVNKEELKQKIQEIKEDIEKSESEIREMEHQIEDLEYDLDFERSNLSDLESKLDCYEKKLLTLQTPKEQQSYWLNLLCDYTRPQLDGQFERNGKWYVCNGYVLLESNEKFDDLKICEGTDSLPSLFDKEKEKIDFDIESYDNEYIGDRVSVCKWLTVEGTYLIACKNILQLNIESKFYSSTGQTSIDCQKNLICENKNGRCLILGVRTWED